MKKLIQFVSFNFLFCSLTIAFSRDGVSTFVLSDFLFSSFALITKCMSLFSFANLTHSANSSPIILTAFSFCFTWSFNLSKSSEMWSPGVCISLQEIFFYSSSKWILHKEWALLKVLSMGIVISIVCGFRLFATMFSIISRLAITVSGLVLV